MGNIINMETERNSQCESTFKNIIIWNQRPEYAASEDLIKLLQSIPEFQSTMENTGYVDILYDLYEMVELYHYHAITRYSPYHSTETSGYTLVEKLVHAITYTFYCDPNLPLTDFIHIRAVLRYGVYHDQGITYALTHLRDDEIYTVSKLLFYAINDSSEDAKEFQRIYQDTIIMAVLERFVTAKQSDAYGLLKYMEYLPEYRAWDEIIGELCTPKVFQGCKELSSYSLIYES